MFCVNVFARSLNPACVVTEAGAILGPGFMRSSIICIASKLDPSRRLYWFISPTIKCNTHVFQRLFLVSLAFYLDFYSIFTHETNITYITAGQHNTHGCCVIQLTGQNVKDMTPPHFKSGAYLLTFLSHVVTLLRPPLSLGCTSFSLPLLLFLNWLLHARFDI